MRTISRSCAILCAFITILPGCAGEQRRASNYGEPVAGQRFGKVDFASAEEGLRLARSMIDAGAGEQALAILEAAHRRYPQDRNILSAYGRQAVAIGQDALAERLLDRALQLNPRDWRALSARAVMIGRQGRYADARADLIQARAISAGNATILNNLGVSYLLGGQTGDAAAMFRRALLAPSLNHGNAQRVKGNLAIALAVEGDFEAAEQLSGRSLPRMLAGADGRTIATYMGMTGHPAIAPSGWTARLAAAPR